MAGVFAVPLHCLVLPPNLPAGLSPWVLFAIAHDRRNGGADVRDPVAVVPHPDLPGMWLVRDGRHRVIASWIAGCPDVLCEVVETCTAGVAGPDGLRSAASPGSLPPSAG